MVIKATIDRIEDGNAVLISDEIGVEISIPLNTLEGKYTAGEVISVTIDN